MDSKWIDLIIQIMGLLVFAAQKIPEIKSEVENINTKIKEFLDENREPTQQEWDELNKRLEAAHKRIQEA